VPRTADHDQRRAQILGGLLRVAARDGLHAVTMRSVAAEAGVSLRLVQYYFTNKALLMRAALDRLDAESRARWADRLAALGPAPGPRARVGALLAEALPTDGPSRLFHLVWTSSAVLALTDPDLAAQAFTAGPARLERDLAAALTADRDHLAPGADPATEAARLLALAHGLGTGVLSGLRTPASAREVLDYHLDRLFPGLPAPATDAAPGDTEATHGAGTSAEAT
jgi:AcrR family transcriptional regulator